MADYYAEREKLYEKFVERIRAIETHRELRAFLASEMPQPDTPGRIHFTNLDWFLSALRRPGQATDAEWRLYESLARRFVESGEWDPEVLKTFEG